MQKTWVSITIILTIALLVSIWCIYDQKARYHQLRASHEQLLTELQAMQEQLQQEIVRSQALEKQTVEGILRETNKAVISGWETLLDKVEDELDRARSALPKDQPPAETEQDQTIDSERT